VYFQSLVPPTAWAGFLTARAAFELGQIAERDRRHGEAASYYARALDLWEHGGEEVAAWRNRAREAAARVSRRAG
jgi:hypothetical protein